MSTMEQYAVKSVAAFDAAYKGGKDSAGFLYVADPRQPEETRLGRVITIPECLYSIWGEQSAFIARLELGVILVAMAEVARWIRGANSVGFNGSVAALMALVKRIEPVALTGPDGEDHTLGLIGGTFNAIFRTHESEADWADKMSRAGTQGNWAPRNVVVDRGGVATGRLTLLAEQ